MPIWGRFLLGGGLGLLAGAALGYYGKCAGGACPLTANPWRGAIVGAVLGLLVVAAVNRSSFGSSEEALKDIPAVTDATFGPRVLEADRPVLVDVYTDWCGYCKQIAPTIAALAKEYAGRLNVVKVDGDAAGQIVRRYGIRGYPTVLLFAGGQVVGRWEGARDEAVYRRAIEEALTEGTRER